MLATLTGFALQLLRIVPLILVAIKRKWLAKTPREEALAWKPPPILYDRVVSIPIRQPMGETYRKLTQENYVNFLFIFLYLSVSTRAVIGQFCGPYSTARTAKFESFLHAPD